MCFYLGKRWTKTRKSYNPDLLKLKEKVFWLTLRKERKKEKITQEAKDLKQCGKETKHSRVTLGMHELTSKSATVQQLNEIKAVYWQTH